MKKQNNILQTSVTSKLNYNKKEYDELKAIFEKMKIERLPQMISEVQRCISNITQKEAFAEDETIKQNINAAMQSITFNFQKLKEEELKLLLDKLN